MYRLLQPVASMAAFLASCFLLMACLTHSVGSAAEGSALEQFGRPGAFLAGPLFHWFGPGAYVPALGATVGSALWFARVPVTDAWLRAVGVVITAAVLSTMAAELAGPERRLDGGAGIVGIAGSTYVLGQFGAVTTVLVLAGALGVGLILAIDNVMLLGAHAVREIRRLGLRAGIESLRASPAGAGRAQPATAAVGVATDDRGATSDVREPSALDERFDPDGRFDPDADFTAGGLSDPSDTVCGDTAMGASAPEAADRSIWDKPVEEAASVRSGEDIEISISADGEVKFGPAPGPRPQPTDAATPGTSEAAPVEPTTVPTAGEAVASVASGNEWDEDARANAIAADIAQAQAVEVSTAHPAAGASSEAASLDPSATAPEASAATTDDAGGPAGATEGEAEAADAPRRRRLGLRELLPTGDTFAGVTEPAVPETSLPAEIITEDESAESAATSDTWSSFGWDSDLAAARAADETPTDKVQPIPTGSEADAPTAEGSTIEAADAGEAAAPTTAEPSADPIDLAGAFAGFGAATIATPAAEANPAVEPSEPSAEAPGGKSIVFDEAAFASPTDAAEWVADAGDSVVDAAGDGPAQAAVEPAPGPMWTSADEWPAGVVDSSSPAAFDLTGPTPASTDGPADRPVPAETAADGSTTTAAETGVPDEATEPAGRGTADAAGLPDLDLLDDAEYRDSAEVEMYVRDQASILEGALADFGVNAQVVAVETGPVVTMFELDPAPGVKINRITALENDLARALKAPSVRVVAPLPNKDTVGLEVPNAVRDTVRLKELMTADPEAAAAMHIPLYLGKDAAGKPLTADLTAMPHLLIAGTTGSGKSVCINAIIMSVLMTRRPDEVKLILVDPKIVETAPYKDVPHLMCPLVNDMRKAEGILEWAAAQMDERYSLLAEAGVRNIAGYNRLTAQERAARFGAADEAELTRIPARLPYIVVVIDELADLMMTSGKQVETLVTRLAQKSRAVGIHMILATQRPSVDVITGLIKANMPARIAFRVAGKVDSRTILDQKGADALLGEGDMLFMAPGGSNPTRAQGTFVSDEEIGRAVGALTGSAEFAPELMQESSGQTDGGQRDELFDDACRIVLESARGSVSLLQRRLNIGYSRASRLIDRMAEAGIVGEFRGSAARDVLMTLQEWETLRTRREGADD